MESLFATLRLPDYTRKLLSLRKSALERGFR